jgi:hypothetical protein
MGGQPQNNEMGEEAFDALMKQQMEMKEHYD